MPVEAMGETLMLFKTNKLSRTEILEIEERSGR
jgi:hypothetical protein